MGRSISLLTDCTSSRTLTPFGLQASSNNSALEFFLREARLWRTWGSIHRTPIPTADTVKPWRPVLPRTSCA